MSRVGHLSNDALADFLTTDYDGGAEFLILAHLSEQNNHPEIARMTAERALGGQRSLFLQNRLDAGGPARTPGGGSTVVSALQRTSQGHGGVQLFIDGKMH